MQAGKPPCAEHHHAVKHTPTLPQSVNVSVSNLNSTNLTPYRSIILTTEGLMSEMYNKSQQPAIEENNRRIIACMPNRAHTGRFWQGAHVIMQSMQAPPCLQLMQDHLPAVTTHQLSRLPKQHQPVKQQTMRQRKPKRLTGRA